MVLDGFLRVVRTQNLKHSMDARDCWRLGLGVGQGLYER